MHQLTDGMSVDIQLLNDGVSYEWQDYEVFLSDMAKIKAKRPSLYNRVSCMGSSSIATSDHWWGCKSFYDVQNKVANGWPELRERLERMMQGIELDLPTFPTLTTVRRRKRLRSDHGDSLDIGRVWNGQLDTAWERPVRTERVATNTKRITLAFDVTANASVTNDMALWRAALCTVLVDSLARAGRVFEIWVVDSTSNPFTWGGSRPMRLWSAWCVKRTADPLVLDRLCSMVSVGFMRSAGFMAMGAGTWEPNSGFGQALGSGLPASLRKRRSAGEVVLRIGECYSRQDVIKEYRRAWEEVEASHHSTGESYGSQCVG